MKKELAVGNRIIGPGFGAFVIAEVGINHDGSPETAQKLITAAAEAGADAVKFQTFRADSLMLPVRERYSQQGDGSESAYELFRRTELDPKDYCQLKRHADNCGITFLSTPFDEDSVDFLCQLGVPAFKVASSDITHVPLLRRIASKGKPIFLSTGMSLLHEVADAIAVLRQAGAGEVLLMHCVSLYPPPAADLNLQAIRTLSERFSLPVGYSDHSCGVTAPMVAVALGALVIEKHFTLDKSAPGPDHKLSLDPPGLKEMIRSIREVEESLGDGRKRPAAAEEEGRRLSRRSIVAGVDIRAYETIAPWMLAFKRPAGGLEPQAADRIVGMTARRNIPKDSLIQWEDLGSGQAPALAGQDRPVIQLHGGFSSDLPLAAGE